MPHPCGAEGQVAAPLSVREVRPNPHRAPTPVPGLPSLHRGGAMTLVTKANRPAWANDLAATLPPLCTFPESANALRCSVKTARRRAAARLLETVRHGSRVLVTRDSILALLGA